MMKKQYYGLMLALILVLALAMPVSGISLNITEINSNSVIINATTQEEYSCYLNGEFKFNSTDNTIVFSDLEPNTKYLVKVSDSKSSDSIIIKTKESDYAGISFTNLVLFAIWLIVLILGILYIPILIIVDIIPPIIMLTEYTDGIGNPYLKFLFAMMIPATILAFGWRVFNDEN